MGKEIPTYKVGTRLTAHLEDGTKGVIEVLQIYFLPDGTEVLHTYPDGILYFERKKGSTVWTAGSGEDQQEVTLTGGGKKTKESPTMPIVASGQLKQKSHIRRTTS